MYPFPFPSKLKLGIAQRIQSIELLLELVVGILPPDLHRRGHGVVLCAERIEGDMDPLEAFESAEQ